MRKKSLPASRLLLFIPLIVLPFVVARAQSQSQPVPQNAVDFVDAVNTGPSWSFSLQPSFGADSEQFSQLLGSTLAVKQSFQIADFLIERNAGHRGRLAVRIPYVRREQTLTYSGLTTSASDSGPGDLSLVINRPVGSRLSPWQTELGFVATLPSGKSVYDNPTDNELPLGAGHYQLSTDVSFRRIADPVAVNLGFGVSYSLPRQHNGLRTSPGFGFAIRTGIGYALSDRWSLVEQLEYSRQPNVFVQDVTSMQTTMFDQAYITHGLTYNPDENGELYSLSFSVGLNNSSTDYLLTIGVTK